MTFWHSLLHDCLHLMSMYEKVVGDYYKSLCGSCERVRRRADILDFFTFERRDWICGGGKNGKRTGHVEDRQDEDTCLLLPARRHLPFMKTLWHGMAVKKRKRTEGKGTCLLLPCYGQHETDWLFLYPLQKKNDRHAVRQAKTKHMPLLSSLPSLLLSPPDPSSSSSLPPLYLPNLTCPTLSYLSERGGGRERGNISKKLDRHHFLRCGWQQHFASPTHYLSLLPTSHLYAVFPHLLSISLLLFISGMRF